VPPPKSMIIRVVAFSRRYSPLFFCVKPEDLRGFLV